MDHTGFCPRAELHCPHVLPGSFGAARRIVTGIGDLVRQIFAFVAQHRGRILGATLTLAIVTAIIAVTLWTMSVDPSGGLVHAGGLPAGGDLWQSVPASPANPVP